MALVLTVSLDAAITSAATMTTNAKEQNAMKAPDRANWIACDVEMTKLRERNCWTVVKRADIPKGTRSWEEDGPLITNGMRPEPSTKYHTEAAM